MLPAYRLKLYRNFKALEASDFYGIIRYYERLEDDIRSLDQEEYLDCTVTYTEALFQTGDYGRHLVMCDHLLEFIIMQNVENWGGEDIYTKILFRKAASLYRQQEYAKAEHILRELIKLLPDNRLAIRLFERCMLLQRPTWLFRLRAAALVLLLVSVAVIVAEIFIVKPFFPDYYLGAQMVHNGFLGAGLLVILAGESWHLWRCYRTRAGFVQCVLKKARTSGEG
ncbi:MAG: hypothetical protein IT259_00225 [Saprospiraceae bacterium]|nr:hypothetical protein [Saprospiraceae bacterium]